MLRNKIGWIVFLGWMFVMVQPLPAAEDRYIGYYYPAPENIEIYCTRIQPLAEMDKRRRVGFVIGVKEGMSNKAYDSAYAVFAKGSDSAKLIIIAKTDGYLETIYRVRALLADLTNSARTTPIFEESGAPENLTFLDLLTLLGFESVTLSDGANFTHQIKIRQLTGNTCHSQSID
ncbi:hypothetical protein [Sneathiella litorea]|uniref:Molybdopterin-guanine dinucleotide biosynthesis protein A n=1 Tax=Sneathiella litorea TaxID=2606216 RepID=A0A6L8W6S0_9PROT|nr:hypothetical protein [Sneathiella litorea]MZR30213.1 hypothetical protein [Sneathiella litorea]